MGGWLALTRWKLWLIIAVAFVAGMVGIRLQALADGEARARAKLDEARLRAVRKAQEIENEVEALDPDTLKRRANRWVRGADR